jgi:hypothetical protein
MIKILRQKLMLILIVVIAAKMVTAQNSLQANQNEIIFSAVKGMESKPVAIPFLLDKHKKIKFKITGEKAGSFKLVSTGSKNTIEQNLVFAPSNDFIGIAKAKLQVTNAAGKLLIETELRGLSLRGLEGENEPTLKTVLENIRL